MSYSKQKIAILIQKIPGFKEFMTYNDIKETQVRKAAEYIKLRKCGNKQVLFKQLDQAEKFYGVLKGEIAIKIVTNERDKSRIRLRKRSRIGEELIFEDDLNYSLGVEVISFKQGQCFGQWGLLEQKERTGSAVSRGETYLFEIDKRGFTESFKIALNRAEMNKKRFLASILAPLSLLPQYKIDQIYKKMVPIVGF